MDLAIELVHNWEEIKALCIFKGAVGKGGLKDNLATDTA